MPVSQTEISVREMRVQARMTLLLLLLLVFLLLFHLSLSLSCPIRFSSFFLLDSSIGRKLSCVLFAFPRLLCVVNCFLSWVTFAYFRDSKTRLIPLIFKPFPLSRLFISEISEIIIFSRKIILDRDINSVSKVEFTKSWLRWKTIMKFYYGKLENWKFSLWLEN